MSAQRVLIDVPAVAHPPGESDEFYTPRELFSKWHQEFDFTLDVCATEESACVPRFFDIAKDGLTESWAGERVWCNPPYSNIAPWVLKADYEMKHGCELVAMLLPANRTEQPWWHEYVEPFRDGNCPAEGWAPDLETRFLRSRFKFGFPGDPTGKTGHQPTFGCVLLVWRSTR